MPPDESGQKCIGRDALLWVRPGFEGGEGGIREEPAGSYKLACLLA